MIVGAAAVLLGFGVFKAYYWFKWRKIERNQQHEV